MPKNRNAAHAVLLLLAWALLILVASGCTMTIPPGAVDLEIQRGNVELDAGAVHVSGDVEGFKYHRADPLAPPAEARP